MSFECSNCVFQIQKDGHNIRTQVCIPSFLASSDDIGNQQMQLASVATGPIFLVVPLVVVVVQNSEA